MIQLKYQKIITSKDLFEILVSINEKLIYTKKEL